MSLNHNRYEDRIIALDGIRGLAIIAVVIAHGLCPIASNLEFMRYVKAVASLGSFGVDLFFVLSGFLISRILYQNHNSKNLLKVFWIRRTFRIMPLYFVFIAILYLVCIIFLPNNLPVPPFLAYALYCQNFYLISGATSNQFGFDITWSLVIEEHFYMFFPLLIALLSRKHFFLIVTTICLIGLPFRYILHPWLEHKYGFSNLNFLLITGRLDQLGIGAFLALMIYNGKKINPRIFSQKFVCMAWVLVFLAKFSKTLDNMMPAIASILTIGSVMNANWIQSRKFFESSVLLFFGRISYALYLFHTPLFWFAHKSNGAMESITYVLLASILAIFLAWISTKYFEEPILKCARKYTY